MNQILYAKTAGKIAKTELWLYDINKDVKQQINEINQPGSLHFDQGVGCPESEDCEIFENQSNRYSTQFVWSPDSTWFLSIWTSRDATQSKALACTIVGDCKQAGREDGGISGSWLESNGQIHWDNDDSKSNGHGWVGSFGPFYPILTNKFGEYFTIYSKKTGPLDDSLHAYKMK